MEMLEYVLNTSTNVFCQYCPRREGLRRGAASEEQMPSFSGRRPSTHWTGIGLLKEGVMFGQLSFVVAFVGFRIVHGWMGMDV